ncbi:hypothetical protein OPQ81_006259 [Rhizoctonia solani]|nr:hypothetical protein OPQ81_006259 [Rhizoctonia solani]
MNISKSLLQTCLISNGKWRSIPRDPAAIVDPPVWIRPNHWQARLDNLADILYWSRAFKTCLLHSDACNRVRIADVLQADKRCAEQPRVQSKSGGGGGYYSPNSIK